MKTRVALLVGVILVLCACSNGSSETPPDPETTATPTQKSTTAPTTAPPTVKATTPPTTEAAWNLPRGFPKVVKVSTLPDQVRSWYEMGDNKTAVAVAPGVWAELPPGATIEDAIGAAVFDGFCASKRAFERKYLAGEETAGTCW